MTLTQGCKKTEILFPWYLQKRIINEIYPILNSLCHLYPIFPNTLLISRIFYLVKQTYSRRLFNIVLQNIFESTLPKVPLLGAGSV